MLDMGCSLIADSVLVNLEVTCYLCSCRCSLIADSVLVNFLNYGFRLERVVL